MATMATGGIWSYERHHEAGHLESPICQECQHPVGDAVHLHVDCPVWQQAHSTEDPDVLLAGEARERGWWADCRALWQRGLVPWGLYGPQILATPGPESWERAYTWAGGITCPVVYTDGSGINPADHRIRRCGWGVWGESGWARGPLASTQQTVFRAELYAVVWALEHSQGPLEVVSDCKGVVNRANGILEGDQVHSRLHHVDLRLRYQRAVSGRRIHVRWVPAHLPWYEAGGPRITRTDWWGNGAADQQAQDGVKLHPDQQGRDERVRLLDGVARGVTKMAIAVHLAIRDSQSPLASIRDANPRPGRAPRAPRPPPAPRARRGWKATGTICRTSLRSRAGV